MDKQEMQYGFLNYLLKSSIIQTLSSSMVLCRYPVYLYTFGNDLDLRTWKIKIEYFALIHSKEWRMDPFCIKFRRILSKILKSTLYIFGTF